jgi:hypothetical protein
MNIGPYNTAEAITKHDSTNIPGVALHGPTHAVYVGGAGIVVAVFEDGSTASFTAIAGQVLPIAIKRVNSTNTTATLMLALWQK